MKSFSRICHDLSPFTLFQIVVVLSFSIIALSLFIWSTLRTFLSYMYGEMCTLFRCSHSNCPWYSFVCSVATYDFHFLFMLSCWWSLHRVSTFFFDSSIYFPLHKQSNWYTPGWLFGGSFGLFFLQRLYCKFFSQCEGNFFPNFLELTFFWTVFLDSLASILDAVIVVFYYQIL